MTNNVFPSKVTFFKHPIHAALVDFPLAFLSGAFLSDLGYLATGDLFWARASFWLISIGLLSGLLSAITGAIDFFSIEQAQTHPAGWRHFIVNSLALSLTGLNLTLRVEQPETYIVLFGLILSALVALFLMAGGWFGGELSFHYGIGVYSRSDEGPEPSHRNVPA